MFSTKEYLQKKTGPYGIGRLSFLQSLVTEFQDTSSAEARYQVLANLANFAYDPVNYEYMRQLNILDLFLDTLDESDSKLVEYAIGGICNSCLDRENKEFILKHGGVSQVIKCLSSSNEDVVLCAVTSLMFLVTPQSIADITSLPVVECMVRFSQSRNKRLSNLASVFLQDYCSDEQISAARSIQLQPHGSEGDAAT